MKHFGTSLPDEIRGIPQSFKAPLIAALLGLSVSERSVDAVLIQPDSATASSFYDANYSPSHTIDGSGLPAGFNATDAHAAYAAGNHWTTAFGSKPDDAWITWSFNTPQTLDEIDIWNHRSTVPPAANANYEVVLFDLTLYDNANSVLLFLDDVALAPDTAFAQVFSFGGAIAGISSVRLDVEKNQGPSEAFPYTGLAEVAFNRVTLPSSVPEAGPTCVLLGLAAASIAGIRLRAAAAMV